MKQRKIEEAFKNFYECLKFETDISESKRRGVEARLDQFKSVIKQYLQQP